jgi:hypothetical protein
MVTRRWGVGWRVRGFRGCERGRSLGNSEIPNLVKYSLDSESVKVALRSRSESGVRNLWDCSSGIGE